MTTIALFGAGGKMGCMLSATIKDKGYDMRYVEVGHDGIQALEALGLKAGDPESAIPDADVVIFALPDAMLGRISREVIPKLRSGALVLLLDVAVVLAEELCMREDISYFFNHPCHPNILEIRSDQQIICGLIQGSETDYALGEKISRDLHAPVSRVHRLSVEQMGLLEPILAETIGLACLSFLRDATDEAIQRGVPKDAAEEFLLGHLQCLKIFFGSPGSPSEGAILTMKRGAKALAHAGTHIVIADINKDSALRAAEQLRGFGVSTSAFACDVGKRSEVEKLADHAWAKFGHVDIIKEVI